MKSRRAPLLLSIAILGAGSLLMAASPTPVDAAAPQTSGQSSGGGVHVVNLALGESAAPQPTLRAALGEPSTHDLPGRSVAATRIAVAANVEVPTRSDGFANSTASDSDPGWATWLLATLGIVGFVAARRRIAD